MFLWQTYIKVLTQMHLHHLNYPSTKFPSVCDPSSSAYQQQVGTLYQQPDSVCQDGLMQLSWLQFLTAMECCLILHEIGQSSVLFTLNGCCKQLTYLIRKGYHHFSKMEQMSLNHFRTSICRTRQCAALDFVRLQQLLNFQIFCRVFDPLSNLGHVQHVLLAKHDSYQ